MLGLTCVMSCGAAPVSTRSTLMHGGGCISCSSLSHLYDITGHTVTVPQFGTAGSCLAGGCPLIVHWSYLDLPFILP
jgi:hypothetical protein